MSSFTAGDLESPPSSTYSPLLSPKEPAPPTWRKHVFLSLALMLLMLSGLAAFIFIHGTDVKGSDPVDPWTNEMLSWQRSGFHFQPEKNWMNDPNGPMYYQGWYHFFYQYNPNASVWGNISWGHAVSKDLLNWTHLRVALSPGPNGTYDHDGVWSGSATVLPDGRVIMIYTGLLNGTQVQNIARPANISDPRLLDWIKDDSINPVMVPPHGVGADDFRDPSTAWSDDSNSTWRVAIGAKNASNSGIVLVYNTTDFKNFTLLPEYLHTVEKVGMLECIDFYPIKFSKDGKNVTKYVLKASTQNDGHDYYAIGSYNSTANRWTLDAEELDIGVLRYDWGMFYASKTFYDEVKKRQILWGWVKEADNVTSDITKGWASLQGIPRSVHLDPKFKGNLLTWPIEEVENLRTEHKNFSEITVNPGSIFPLNVSGADQLDIEVEFMIDKEALETVGGEDVEYECGKSGGAAQRGLLGPFGLLVLANGNFTEQTATWNFPEQTATYFYVSKKSDDSLITHFCQDELRSTKANDTVKEIVGHTVPFLDGESFTLRVLVDHSIVESFAQGGRASATSRVYPTEAIYGHARLYVFNNATRVPINVSSLNVWRMKSPSNSNFMRA